VSVLIMRHEVWHFQVDVPVSILQKKKDRTRRAPTVLSFATAVGGLPLHLQTIFPLSPLSIRWIVRQETLLKKSAMQHGGFTGMPRL
jgi:hypothetical protein